MAKAEHVKKALDLFGAELERKENVVGLGRVPTDGGGPGDWSLAVYVSRKVPDDQLDREDRVPKTLEVPGKSASHEVATKVIEQGPVGLESL